MGWLAGWLAGGYGMGTPPSSTPAAHACHLPRARKVRVCLEECTEYDGYPVTPTQPDITSLISCRCCASPAGFSWFSHRSHASFTDVWRRQEKDKTFCFTDQRAMHPYDLVINTMNLGVNHNRDRKVYIFAC
ncbi:hypothetical protein TEQG_06616 [Trichophyton equinum CBS 127.97]|uniref:Uncharacterized protein n=1 Tax=Trichophyton equinum (strain ATCC MYA-4606 / CBS 127.97) TaxID=559882 RepID=F2Q0G3_TRIEC|nr:hypothetical protein TEQG_06616 [Trichophyton equinum CBS 127.97]